MIVGVDPGADDFDETMSAMRFAQMAREVVITRAVGTCFPCSIL